MSTISSLNIYLNAQSDGFNKGIQSATKETVRFMMQLDLQARTLGMSATEAKLYQLEMRGVEKSLIDVARETAATVAALQSQAAATDSAKALVTELKLEAETFHMTATEAQIYKLALAGANNEVLQAARDHALFIQFLKEERAALQAAAIAAKQQAAAIAAAKQQAAAIAAKQQAAAIAAAKQQAAAITSSSPAAGGGLLDTLSQAKGLGGLLKGGGMVAGLAIIASQAEQASAKLLELSSAYRAGEISAHEFAAEGVRGLPILGNAIKFFDNIRDSYYGWSAAAAETMRIEGIRTQQLEKQIAGLEQYKAALKEVYDSLGTAKADAEWQIALMTKSPLMRSIAEIGKAAREQRDELIKQTKERITEIERLEAQGLINSKTANADKIKINTELNDTLRKMDELAAKRTGGEIAKGIGDVAKNAADAIQPFLDWAAAMRKAKEARDALAKRNAIQDQITELKASEEQMKGMVDSIGDQMSNIPRSLQFASVGVSQGDSGIGAAFKGALQTNFGLDAAKGKDALDKQRNKLLEDIKENTKQQKILQATLN